MSTGLVWGLKSSFLEYLGRMPDSQWVLAGGAGTTPTGEFYFELADDSGFARGSGLGTLKFRGSVRFSAHHGMLFVMITDPWMEFGADGIVLSVEDPASGPEGDGRVSLVAVAPVIPTETTVNLAWTSMPTSLLPAGVEVFNDVYAVGEPFAPLHLRIPLVVQTKGEAPAGV